MYEVVSGCYSNKRPAACSPSPFSKKMGRVARRRSPPKVPAGGRGQGREGSTACPGSIAEAGVGLLYVKDHSFLSKAFANVNIHTLKEFDISLYIPLEPGFKVKIPFLAHAVIAF